MAKLLTNQLCNDILQTLFFILCSLAQSTFLREVKWQLAEVCFVCTHFPSEIVMLRMLELLLLSNYRPIVSNFV